MSETFTLPENRRKLCFYDYGDTRIETSDGTPVSSGGGSGASEINGLDDVSISSPQDGHILTYDASATFQAEILAKNPEVYWRLGESSGTTANDASGNGNNGTYVDTPSFGATGGLGDGNSAVTFNGTSEGVKGAIPAALINNSEVSIYVMVKTTQAAATIVAISPQGNYSVGKGFAILLSGGKARVRAGNGSGFEFLTGDVTINDGEWHHLCATYDGTTLRLYVDGTEDVNDNGAWAGTIDWSNTSIGPTGGQLYVSGERNNTSGTDPNGFFFDGTVDEVSFHTVTLSASDVSTIYSRLNASASWANNSLNGLVEKDLGEFTVANLPAAADNTNFYALATNASGGRTIVRSDGTNWKVVAVEGATVTT